MDKDTELKDKLRRSLGKVLRSPDIRVVYAGWGNSGWSDAAHALISVVSPTFEQMDEGRRQEIVWERLLEDFSSEEQERIDFVYTDAPSELEADDPRRRPEQAGATSDANPNG